jgi:hypothetical protein
MANAKAVQALVNRGADAMDNMFDVSIQFPWAEAGSVVTTRIDGFNIPDAGNDGYDISYHGVTMKRPSSKHAFNREFELTFVLDAAYALYGEFVNWSMMVADPVNGGVANWAAALGTVKVTALSGAYNGTSTGDIYNAEDGSITGDANPTWTFYDVWVSKVGQPQFKTAGGDALTYAVSFKFGDCDYPFYNATGITGTGDGGAVK